eukprot:2676390-Rhodomonas_salina.1
MGVRVPGLEVGVGFGAVGERKALEVLPQLPQLTRHEVRSTIQACIYDIRLPALTLLLTASARIT